MPDWVTKYWVEWAFGVVAVALTAAYRRLSRRVRADKAKEGAVSAGVQALLRDRLIQAYNHYREQGYCPIYARENMEDMYLAYHGLDGNGTVTGLMESVRKMPTEKTKNGGDKNNEEII